MGHIDCVNVRPHNTKNEFGRVASVSAGASALVGLTIGARGLGDYGMKTISFTVSLTDARLIAKIVNRAMALGIEGYDRMTCGMDLTACHANGCELNLNALLAAKDFDFTHDILGIRQHINRETGELENCFAPRYAA